MGYINGKYYFQNGMSFGTTYQDFTLTFNFLYNDEECTSMVWNFNNSQTLPQYEVDLLNGLNVVAVKTYDISTALWLDDTFNISIPFQEVTTNFDFLVKNLTEGYLYPRPLHYARREGGRVLYVRLVTHYGEWSDLRRHGGL